MIVYRNDSRRGGANPILIVGILLAILICGGVWWILSGRENSPSDQPLMTVLERGPYEHIVLEQGEIQSSENVEVRCNVKSRSTGSSVSTTILDIIPEGTTVKKGDWLITFDSNYLESIMTNQNIIVKTSQTLVIQGKAAYDTAVMAKKEYLEGTYQQEEKTIENEIFVAEDNLKKAQLSYDSIKRSVSRGLVGELQLQGEKFTVDAAVKQLELAKQKLHVLASYTKAKMLTQFNSDIEATKIKWENEEASYQEELKTLEEFREQIKFCTVTAPQDGQVVYANVMSRRGGGEFVVEPGATVRERQTIIRLPNPTKMQVSANVSESQINLVRESMPCSIRIDAIGDETFKGVVTKVNKYAEPGSWWSSSTKEYKTTIQIIDPPARIRPGLTAEVRIQIENETDALQLPVQAIVEHRGRTFCLAKSGDQYHTHPIAISSTNDKVVAIDDQAADLPAVGSDIVLHPRSHMELFDFEGFTFEDEQNPTDASGYATEDGESDRGGNVAQRPGRGGPPAQAGRGRPSGSGGRPAQAGRGRPSGSGGPPAQAGRGRPSGSGGPPAKAGQGGSSDKPAPSRGASQPATSKEATPQAQSSPAASTTPETKSSS